MTKLVSISQTGSQNELQKHIGSIQEILSRGHQPNELQAKIDELQAALETGDMRAKNQLEIAYLGKAREQIKALLSHAHLQAGQNAEASAGLEKIVSMLHPMQSIARMYDYSPHPETIEQVDLEVDWQMAEQAVVNSDFIRFDQIGEGSEGVSRREHREIEFIEKSICHAEVPCNQSQPLILEGRKVIRKDKAADKVEEGFIFELSNPNASEDDYAHHGVANLAFRKVEHADGTEWDMNDRIVAEAYRNQGVAPKMLGMMEQMVHKYAQVAGKPQAITAEVGQVNVLVWLLKQGYKPKSQEDEQRINRLLSGADSLAIASAPDDAHEIEKRQWFIFEKDKLLNESGEQKSEVWADSNYGNPEHYMKSSCRINLKKEIR